MEQKRTIKEIINDPVFIESIRTQIEKVKTQVDSRTAPKPGMRYARSWYERMCDDKMLRTDIFINEIEAIWEKRSKLNAEYRAVIRSFCEVALLEVLRKKQPETIESK